MFSAYLISASLPIKAVKCFEGERNELLMRLAAEHTASMCKRDRQDHRNFQTRYNTIQKQLQCHATEVCCESWPWNEEPQDAAADMFESWEKSEGHWGIIIRKHDFFGCAMQRCEGGMKVWYATILVADMMKT